MVNQSRPHLLRDLNANSAISLQNQNIYQECVTSILLNAMDPIYKELLGAKRKPSHRRSGCAVTQFDAVGAKEKHQGRSGSLLRGWHYS